MTYQSPQGLASLGRNGDSMLVHMSPSEVAGLQGLAMAQGGSLTINPKTGLPEAFKLGGFFKSLLPTIVGAGFGFAAAPLWAGIAAGAATGAVTNRDNPLMGAALGGLGGYGGMGIGSALKSTLAITNPATVAPTVAPSAVSGIGPGAMGTTGQIGGANLIGSGIAGGTAGTNAATANLMGAMKTSGVNIADPIAQDVAKQTLQTVPKTSTLSGVNMDPTSNFLKPTVLDANYAASTIQPSGTAGGSTLIGEGRNLANSAASAQNPLIAASMSNSPTPGFMDTFIDELGGTSAATRKLGLPLAGGVLGGLEPSDIYGKPIQPSEKDRYDPYSTLNLSGDTGLRLVAKGGEIKSYAIGGNVGNPSVGGGLSDLYNRPEGQTTQNISNDAYGLGRLSELGNEQARYQAQTLGYAMGGPVSFADGGDSNKQSLELPALAPDANVTPNIGMGSSLGRADIQNIITSTAPFKFMPGLQKNMTYSYDRVSEPSDSSLITKVATNLKTDPDYKPANSIEDAIIKQMRGETTQDTNLNAQGLGSLAPTTPMAPTYNASQAITPTYYAGLNAPRGYARGGYLNGPGDGMSDSIPATIEGKQPARLADGEFVIPADVVSHLGNGSTKAGSKKLYAMMDKVRRARTGHTKQGKQINPDKYLPKVA